MATDAVTVSDNTKPTAQPAASDNLQPHTMQPSMAEINAAGANGRQAALDALNKQFGPLTLTDAGEKNLCDVLAKAPQDARSANKNPATGAIREFNWQDGTGSALSVDPKNGHAEACVMYKNGTVSAVSGEYDRSAAPGTIPIKPKDVEVLSGGGKLEFKAKEDGSAALFATDPFRNTQEFPVNGNMKDVLRQATGNKDFKVLWGETGPKGLSFMPTSANDSPAKAKQVEEWKARHHVQ
ncbi:MAG: hypothetical protein JST01_21595 [Cyanobacteria bacterium SZAS TMP-1]|nr:hypothetical protein [Cyanobacteria bacterium SZAS TMP-1]